MATAACAAVTLVAGCSQAPLKDAGHAAVAAPTPRLLKPLLPPAPARKPSAIEPATEEKAEALAEPGQRPDAEPAAWQETGLASRYAGRFQGRRTASGERYNQRAFTAAHPTLPFGTWVRVRNLHNDQEVRVRINDRGPFVAGRVIDLSYVAAQELGLLRRGLGEVTLRMDDDSL